MEEPILKFENTSKSFGKRVILDRINLEICSGEIFGIIGPSGIGKTTFLKTLIGYYTPNEGDILFAERAGREYAWRSIFSNLKGINKIFGFAAQQPSFYDQLTVYENLDYFSTLYNVSAQAKKVNCEALIKFMNLDKARNSLAKNLSGGMRRRLDIACALSHNPEILVLDEPTSDLDPILANHIWNLLKKINKKGTTIILASHHISDLEQICSRIGILLNGKLSPVGTIPELFKTVKKCQEIHLETYPGNYDTLLHKFNDESVIKKENRGFETIIYTTKPEKVLHKLLHHLNTENEAVLDLKITKIKLDDIYLSIVGRK